jgi:hypothetical protein
MPSEYPLDSRESRITGLIVDEICRAPPMLLHLPMPRDPRLQRICKALVDEPGHEGNLEDWARHGALSLRSLTRLFRSRPSHLNSATTVRAHSLQCSGVRWDAHQKNTLRPTGTGEPRPRSPSRGHFCASEVFTHQACAPQRSTRQRSIRIVPRAVSNRSKAKSPLPAWLLSRQRVQKRESHCGTLQSDSRA